MSNAPRPDSGKPRVARRSLFETLFFFRTDGLLSPLVRSTRLFLHIIAGTFAIYKLLPKDYPGLQNPDASLSLFHIFATAWKNVRLTREGAMQALLFFAVLGIMVAGVVIVFSFIVSLFISPAHADSIFLLNDQQKQTDAAYGWVEYLFNDGALPSMNTINTINSVRPDASAWGVQASLKEVLGFYSNAMLIIAALVLFYHLTTMVIQTAHSGVPMGKPERQVWAPIRLVLAVGILVPIASSLNTGQYVVIKTAEMGSALATHAWDLFLDKMSSPRHNVLPKAPMVTEIASQMIASYACEIDYNARIQKAIDVLNATSGYNFGSLAIDTFLNMKIRMDNDLYPPGKVATVNGMSGMKYSFSTNDLGGEDICGSFFIPGDPTNVTPLLAQIYEAESQTFKDNLQSFHDAGQLILGLVPTAEGGTLGATDFEINAKFIAALTHYQMELVDKLDAIVQNNGTVDNGVIDQVIAQIRPFGWSFAGTFLPTINRIQSSISDSIGAGMPVTTKPKMDTSALAQITNFLGMPTLTKVYEDLKKLNLAMNQSWTQGTVVSGMLPETAVQCASMLGVGGSVAPHAGFAGLLPFINEKIDFVIDQILNLVDWVASWDGVWSNAPADQCTSSSAGGGRTTFVLGINLSNGPDVLQEIIRYGHAIVSTGLRVAGIGALAMAGGTILTAVSAFAGPVGIILGGIAGGMLAFFGSVLEMFAMVFLTLGFVFAYIVPLIPFTRFFFAVVIWIGEVVESVIAIPIVALAHLNPEGEGFLGEQAKQSYYFVFGIFLRPILSIFGLIAGLMIFIVSASFATYAYGFAVAASGGTAYGHLILSKFIYTILYVGMIFICANKSFEMITHIPEQALSWMKASKAKSPSLGDISEMQKYETAAAGIAASQGVGAISGAIKQGGQGIAGMATQARQASLQKEQINTLNKAMGISTDSKQGNSSGGALNKISGALGDVGNKIKGAIQPDNAKNLNKQEGSTGVGGAGSLAQGVSDMPGGGGGETPDTFATPNPVSSSPPSSAEGGRQSPEGEGPQIAGRFANMPPSGGNEPSGGGGEGKK